MYGWIDNDRGQLRDVYSNEVHAFAYGDGSTATGAFNCEHLVPQSAFRLPTRSDAQEPMRSDLHHLRASHSTTNGARSHFAFGEVEDTTASWYRDAVAIPYTSVELSTLGAYSELSADRTRWEPCERS